MLPRTELRPSRSEETADSLAPEIHTLVTRYSRPLCRRCRAGRRPHRHLLAGERHRHGVLARVRGGVCRARGGGRCEVSGEARSGGGGGGPPGKCRPPPQPRRRLRAAAAAAADWRAARLPPSRLPRPPLRPRRRRRLRRDLPGTRSRRPPKTNCQAPGGCPPCPHRPPPPPRLLPHMRLTPRGPRPVLCRPPRRARRRPRPAKTAS